MRTWYSVTEIVSKGNHRNKKEKCGRGNKLEEVKTFKYLGVDRPRVESISLWGMSIWHR